MNTAAIDTIECPACVGRGTVQYPGHFGVDHECERCKGAGELALCAQCGTPSDTCEAPNCSFLDVAMDRALDAATENAAAPTFRGGVTLTRTALGYVASAGSVGEASLVRGEGASALLALTDLAEKIEDSLRREALMNDESAREYQAQVSP